jgi:hypothetical protein
LYSLKPRTIHNRRQPIPSPRSCLVHPRNPGCAGPDRRWSGRTSPHIHGLSVPRVRPDPGEASRLFLLQWNVAPRLLFGLSTRLGPVEPEGARPRADIRHPCPIRTESWRLGAGVGLGVVVQPPNRRAPRLHACPRWYVFYLSLRDRREHTDPAKFTHTMCAGSQRIPLSRLYACPIATWGSVQRLVEQK